MEKHKNKATTVRFNAKDKENIERIKSLYACTSDIAAIRVALQLAVTQSAPFIPLRFSYGDERRGLLIICSLTIYLRRGPVTKRTRLR